MLTQHMIEYLSLPCLFEQDNLFIINQFNKLMYHRTNMGNDAIHLVFIICYLKLKEISKQGTFCIFEQITIP